MKNNILLTIILPVYNVEKYLNRAVDSVLQCDNRQEIEILLVDDGSSDSCGAICDEYSEKHHFIKIFHKKNGGLSDARNYGLYRATGEYVYFMDSDDCLNDNAINEILYAIKNRNMDVLLFDSDIINEAGDIISVKDSSYYIHQGLEPGRAYKGVDVISSQLKAWGDYATTVWLGVYKKSLLLDEGLFFEKGLLHEDELWTQKVLLCANEVNYLQEKLYQYRIRDNSIMNTKNKDKSKNIDSLIYIYESLYAYLEWMDIGAEERTLIKANITKRYLHMIYRFNVAKHRCLCKKISKHRIFKNSKGAINKIRAILLCCGVPFYCSIMRVLKNE